MVFLEHFPPRENLEISRKTFGAGSTANSWRRSIREGMIVGGVVSLVCHFQLRAASEVFLSCVSCVLREKTRVAGKSRDRERLIQSLALHGRVIE